jgi:hypothetical protein
VGEESAAIANVRASITVAIPVSKGKLALQPAPVHSCPAVEERLARENICNFTSLSRKRWLQANAETFLYSATSAILTARSRLRYAPPSLSRRAQMPNAPCAVLIRLHLHAVLPRAEQKSVRSIAILVLVAVHSSPSPFFFIFVGNRGQFIDRKRLKKKRAVVSHTETHASACPHGARSRSSLVWRILAKAWSGGTVCSTRSRCRCPGCLARA